MFMVNEETYREFVKLIIKTIRKVDTGDVPYNEIQEAKDWIRKNTPELIKE